MDEKRSPGDSEGGSPNLPQHMSGPRRWLRLLLSLTIVGIASVVGAQSGLFARSASSPDSAGSTAVSNSGREPDLTTGLTQWPRAERKPLPPIAGTTLAGDRLALADLRGHVLVLNMWGSWCAPCRAEAPDLRRASDETRASGVRFVGIDTRDNAASARAFVREFRLAYPSLVDSDGGLLLAFRNTVPAQAIPSTVVVDRQGGIAARVIGRTTYTTLRGLIDDLLAEGS